MKTRTRTKSAWSKGRKNLKFWICTTLRCAISTILQGLDIISLDGIALCELCQPCQTEEDCLG